MPTSKDIQASGLLDAIADNFRDSVSVGFLLESANIKMSQFAPFGQPTIQDWWRQACYEIGRRQGEPGLTKLLQEVAATYPGDPRFAAILKGPSAIGTNITKASSVFLSYSVANRKDVDELYLALAKNAPQVHIFQDHRSIAAGKDWLNEIQGAASKASLMVAWLTQDYLGSTFCSFEIGIAQNQGSKIIPVMIDPAAGAKAPSYLSRTQMLRPNLPLDFDAMAKELLALLP